MEVFHLALRYVHLIGFAALTMGALLELRHHPRTINKLVFYGSIVQLLSGFILVGLLEMLKEDLDMTKITLKLGIILIIVILSIIFRNKELHPAVYGTLLTLILSASVIAVFF